MGLNPNRKKRNRILSWLINLAGVLVFALLLYFGGIEAWQQILTSDLRYVLAAFAATLLWNLVAAYRWSLIANRLAGDPEICPYRYFFTYHMLGMLMGQVVPVTVGMLGGRPVALSLSQQVPLRRSALSVFVDKLFDLFLAVMLALPVALYLVGWIDRALAFGLIGSVILIGVLLVAWQYEQTVRLAGRVGAAVARPLTRLPLIGRRLVRRLPDQLERLATGTVLENGLAVRTFLLTLAMYSLLAVRLILIARALRLDVPWYLLAMGICITQLALVFSVTPGSLGFLEGGWWAVFSLAGLTLDQLTIFVLGRRAYVLIFTLILALLAFAWIRESPARLFRAVLDASRRSNGEPPPAPSPGEG